MWAWSHTDGGDIELRDRQPVEVQSHDCIVYHVMHLNYHLYPAKWSRIAVFSSGIAMGVIAMAIVPTLRRWRSPRPDKVFTSVLPILRANREVCVTVCVCVCVFYECVIYTTLQVRELVGNGLQPGLFRACVYDGGVKWGGVRWSGAKSGRAGLIPLTFPPCEPFSSLALPLLIIISSSTDTLQLLFQVHGEHSSAMVSLAVRNHTLWGRGLIYDSLVVDLPNGERLVLKGQRSDHAVLQAYTQRLQ